MELELRLDNEWEVSDKEFGFTDMGIWGEPVKRVRRLAFLDNKAHFYHAHVCEWTGLVGFESTARITWEVEDGA